MYEYKVRASSPQKLPSVVDALVAQGAGNVSYDPDGVTVTVQSRLPISFVAIDGIEERWGGKSLWA